MTDNFGSSVPPQPDDVPIKARRKTVWDTVSWIWAIPVIALVIALGAAWRTYSERGPMITVSFPDAGGIRANETQVRYRDINVGLVEEVTFSDNLQYVVASIRIDDEIAPYIDSDARFWVVRPQVSARGVSGLDTVLSGVYIQGAWDNQAGGMQSEFKGLDAMPLLAERQGVAFELRSSEGLPAAGTPILYKNVEVGAIGESTLNAEGTEVTADAVIYEPHTGFVTTSTRFWDISGFSFSFGASGASLDFTSLASLISGGVTFETIGSGGTPIEEGTVYDLFPNEEDAREDFLIEGEGSAVNVAMVFEENLSGLSVGAAVELGGLHVGDVTAINGIVNEERFGDSEVRLIVSARINPGRVGLGEGADESSLLDYLDARIDDGLRARLVNASLFSGGLKISLVEIPNADDASLDRDAEPLPQIPTAPADVADVGATAQGVLQRVSDLPIEEVMQSVVTFLDNASTLIGSSELQRAPEELTGLLAAVRQIAESDGVQELPDQIARLLGNLETTTATLNSIVADLEARNVVDRFAVAVDDVATAANGMPQLIEEARGILDNVGEVPFEQLVERASGLLDAADQLIDQDTTRQLPAELNRALASVRRTLEELQDGGVIENTNQTLASARDAAQAIAEASATLPMIAEQLRAVANQAGATLSAYSGDSQFTRDVQSSLREIEAAANAVESLARAIERNPNSLILGR